ENSKVVSLTVSKDGVRIVTVTGSGKIEKATVNASGAVIEPEPEEVELGEGVSAIIGGEEVVYVPEEDVPGAPPEPEPRVPVTGVTLDKQTLELTVGDAETISATVKPASATNKEAARAVKEGIAVSQDGVDVPAGTYWVTPENMEALDEAIAAAEAAKATVRTQQEVAEAVEKLEAAVSAFNEAKQPAIGEEEAEMLDEGEGPSEAEKPAEGEEPVQSGQPEE
ncbi:MAG TPA: hypothetical protein PK309_08695, partial [Bacillota bacterium]|nr:hypothetical protein [Bacillota bacterium]